MKTNLTAGTPDMLTTYLAFTGWMMVSMSQYMCELEASSWYALVLQGLSHHGVNLTFKVDLYYTLEI